MSFFQHQGNAHKRTKLLDFYFVLVLLTLVVFVAALETDSEPGQFSFGFSKNLLIQS